MSEIKVDKISPQSGTELTLGDTSDDFLLPSGAEIKAKSGSTITVESGATITNSGTATGFGSAGPILGTPVASTSVTTKDFTSIPSGTKRITISYSGVSTSGTSKPIVQLGDAGGVETSGYLGAGFRNGATVANLTDGFGVHSDWSSSVIFHGITILTLLDSSTFTWSSGSVMGRSDATHVGTGGGSKSLSAELDRVRFTTQGGSETFDAGKINILYE